MMRSNCSSVASLPPSGTAHARALAKANPPSPESRSRAANGCATSSSAPNFETSGKRNGPPAGTTLFSARARKSGVDPIAMRLELGHNVLQPCLGSAERCKRRRLGDAGAVQRRPLEQLQTCVDQRRRTDHVPNSPARHGKALGEAADEHAPRAQLGRRERAQVLPAVVYQPVVRLIRDHQQIVALRHSASSATSSSVNT